MTLKAVSTSSSGGGVTSVAAGTGLNGGGTGAVTVGINPALSVGYTVAQSITTTPASNTSNDGLSLIDATPATAANQQFSPRLHLIGQGWGTTGSASVPVDWIIENQPTQGATAGTNLVLSSQINGGGYSASMTLSQGNAGVSFAGTVTSTAGSGFVGANLAVNGANVPVVGVYRPVASVLGFSTVSAARGSFDANGNFITLFATADQSKSVQTPTTGFSITIGNNTSTLYLTPAGTLATGSIALPTTPIDGQQVQVGSSQIITALTVTSSQTINNAPTTIGTAGSGFKYIYHLATTTWLRLY